MSDVVEATGSPASPATPTEPPIPEENGTQTDSTTDSLPPQRQSAAAVAIRLELLELNEESSRKRIIEEHFVALRACRAAEIAARPAPKPQAETNEPQTTAVRRFITLPDGSRRAAKVPATAPVEEPRPKKKARKKFEEDPAKPAPLRQRTLAEMFKLQEPAKQGDDRRTTKRQGRSLRPKL